MRILILFDSLKNKILLWENGFLQEKGVIRPTEYLFSREKVTSSGNKSNGFLYPYKPVNL